MIGLTALASSPKASAKPASNSPRKAHQTAAYTHRGSTNPMQWRNSYDTNEIADIITM